VSGICTFLFTDIEGSTRRWEADPEAMRVALAAHDEVLRGTIATQGFDFQAHGRRGVRGVRLATLGRRRGGGGAACARVAGPDGNRDR
jgi:hypothetical protein